MKSTKITNVLKDVTNSLQPDKKIDVIIELNPIKETGAGKMSRIEKIDFLKNAFEEELRPVANVISSQGDSILYSTWLNQTVKASLSTKSIEQLAELKEVNAIDLPRQIEKEHV